ncbi:MAG TPA: diaminopimelate epimerase [Bacteroidetes bacterium]|nr:diaminopimelate epimerase [Bacteroidota bacterium]
MLIQFFKLQGTGNDFVAIDNRNGQFSLELLAQLAPTLCDRRYGIGADGILALSPSTDDVSDYTMVYLNADGSDAGMCGNGGRCIARLAHHLGFPAKHTFNVHGFPYQVNVEEAVVTLFFPAEPEIQTIPDSEFGQIDIIYTGTEHICIQIQDPNLLDNRDWIRNRGHELRYDSRFAPKGTNVNFYSPIDENNVKLITYERGVEDLTLSCGTGSLAVSICHKRNHTNEFMQVSCPGGILYTKFGFDITSNTYKNLLLKGAAEIVFIGELHV